MPGFAGFICEVTNEPILSADCLDCARKGAPGCEVGSPPILSGILRHIRPAGFSQGQAQDARADVTPDLSFSVTELLGCARKGALMQTEDWYERPSRLYWAYRGTLFHSQAEAYAQDDLTVISEQRLFWFFRLGGKTIALSGQPDLLLFDEQHKGWRIVDFKTTKEVPSRRYRYTCLTTGQVIYEVPYKIKGNANCPHCNAKHNASEVSAEELPPGPRAAHDLQLQVYATLVEKNGAALANMLNRRLMKQACPPDAPILGGELVYLDMSTQKRIQVEIRPAAERMALVRTQLQPRLAGGLPDILRNPLEAWQCNYCPVRPACESHHGGPVGR